MITSPIGISSSLGTGDIQARTAIFELVARFDDAVNRRNVAEFEQLWATDATWQIGNPMPMHVQGASGIVTTWQTMLGATQWLFRGSFTGVIHIEDNRAKGRWPCIETGTFADGKGYDNRAIYEDDYVCRKGRWLFQRRHYHYLWLSQATLPGGPVALSTEFSR